jgi:hypothetical protein
LELNERTRNFISTAKSGIPKAYLEFSDSEIAERMMRIGIEVRYLGCEPSDYKDVAIATLAQDLKKYNPCLCNESSNTN